MNGEVRNKKTKGNLYDEFKKISRAVNISSDDVLITMLLTFLDKPDLPNDLIDKVNVIVTDLEEKFKKKIYREYLVNEFENFLKFGLKEYSFEHEEILTGMVKKHNLKDTSENIKLIRELNNKFNREMLKIVHKLILKFHRDTGKLLVYNKDLDYFEFKSKLYDDCCDLALESEGIIVSEIKYTINCDINFFDKYLIMKELDEQIMKLENEIYKFKAEKI